MVEVASVLGLNMLVNVSPVSILPAIRLGSQGIGKTTRYAGLLCNSCGKPAIFHVPPVVVLLYSAEIAAFMCDSSMK